MMIKLIYIKNFKAYVEKRIHLYQNNIFIGENDSGKSSILQALDAFFNLDSIDKKYVIDANSPVEIGILTSENMFYKKVFRPKSFKGEMVTGNINDLANLRFIYISPNTLDVKKLICDLSISKAISNFSEELRAEISELMEKGIQSVLGSIDNELLVVDGDTNFSGCSSLNIEKAFKYDVISNGVPIEGRGSGFQKNVLYSLLTGSDYENTIIGIDEIENSLSLKNCKDLMRLIKERFLQTLITTHSVSIVKAADSYDINPVYRGDVKTVSELYKSLGDIEKTTYVLVEGKTDVNWIKRSIDILGLTDRFVIIPCGGSHNIEPVKKELEQNGCICKIIKDGDTHEPNSLSRDCIELYITLEKYNELFNKNEEALPTDKNTFFDGLVYQGECMREDAIKRILSDCVNDFLVEGNPLIEEIRKLLIEA